MSRKLSGRKRKRGESFGNKDVLLMNGRKFFKISNMSKRQNIRSGGFIGKELKYIDNKVALTTIDDTVATSNPTTAKCLNSMTQGSGPKERIGNKIVLKSIQIKGVVYLVPSNPVDSTKVTTGESVRVMIYMDKQTNGAQNLTDNILDATGASSMTKLRELQWAQRFKVFYDKSFDLKYFLNFQVNASSTSYMGGEQVSFDFFKKVEIPVQFKDGNGTVASVQDNAIYMLFLTSEGTSNNVAKMTYTSRIRYVG